LNFVDSAGSKTGKLLPSGNVADSMTLSDGRKIRVSLIDAGNPFVFVQASEIGFTGRELPEDSDANRAIVKTLEEVRVRGAVAMGLAASTKDVGPAVPKVGMVSSPHDYTTISGDIIAHGDCDVVARMLALSTMHKACPVTGGICLGTAALMEGSVVHEVAGAGIAGRGMVRVGHPSGVSEYFISVRKNEKGAFELLLSAVAGTARRIMDGHVYVPRELMLDAR
jgi:methylitaconate Delta-isomerase